MGLRESPYSNCFLGGLDAVARDILFPSCWLTSQLLALKQTTKEEQAHKRCPPYTLEALLKGLVIVPLLILSAPFSLLAFLVWLPLQTARRPFAYQHTPSHAPPAEWALPGTLNFVSGNVCLLPDGLAKFSNLSQTQWRAKRIAQGLAKAARRPSRAGLQGQSSSASKTKYGATETSPPRPCSSPPCDVPDVIIEMPRDEECKSKGPSRITAHFPPSADFVCLQEVFDHEATTHVRRILGPSYEHIIYDVGVYGLVGCSALKVFNSGIFLASRHPVLTAQYHCYPNGTHEDAFSAKGLLCVQVQLGLSQGQRVVGYLNCTHLQATEADAQVRSEQLTLSLLWAQQFQDESGQEGDIVAFDIYCGDLNFDNCSSACEIEQANEIFQRYTDPCRIGPRKDQPWAIGTLLNYLEIYREAVSTPESMKRTLEQPEGQRKYLARPILADGSPDQSAACSNGRRIDYILYREHHVELKTVVEEISFITQLATCSDHLPLGLRLRVVPSAQAEA